MAKRGGSLTQSFRQMPNPPLNIVALVAVVPIRRTLGWTTPQCELTHISRDVGLMRRDLSLAFWREEGMFDGLEIGVDS
jgi:hypothetical protein